MWDRCSSWLDRLVDFALHSLYAWAGVLVMFRGAGLDSDAAAYIGGALAIVAVLSLYALVPRRPRRRGRRRSLREIPTIGP